MKTNESVLIIGAGAAGLAAAHDLAAAGVEVTVLEARDRIGGRVFTIHDDTLHLPIELGAEFVHGKHPALMPLLNSFNRCFIDVSDRHWYFENGVLSGSHDFWNKLTALFDLMSKEKPDQSFAAFLDSLPNDPETVKAKHVATRYVQGFHAADIRRAGVHGLIAANEAEDEVEGNHSFRVIAGYETVLQRLSEEAKTLGAVIHLNTKVTELNWTTNKIEAVCVSGSQPKRFAGSRALVTVPLGVLQQKCAAEGAVTFNPSLPSEKQDSIRLIPMGHVVRVVLRFRHRFWEELNLSANDGQKELWQMGFIHYPGAPIPTWWGLLPLHAPILVGWVGGPNAEKFAKLSDAELLSQALSSLEQIFGLCVADLKNELTRFYFHDWNADPFARGAYAYLQVNGLETQRVLARPVDNTLFFAGEATSVGHIGTVHGALESGQRAAKEIIAVM